MTDNQEEANELIQGVIIKKPKQLFYIYKKQKYQIISHLTPQ